MEYGCVYAIKSKRSSETVVIYESERKPGYVYKFYLEKESTYRCCRFKELGKYKRITVKNDRVVGRKHPEDDHHTDCTPLPKDSVLALEVDRDMRHDVREHGKRPRDAYCEMLTNVAKRFKSSEDQVLNVKLFQKLCNFYNKSTLIAVAKFV